MNSKADWITLSELPQPCRVPVLYFPNATREGGNDGMIIAFHPGLADEWIGIFPFGNYSQDCPSVIFEMKDIDGLLVVSRGQGYEILRGSKLAFKQCPLFPILQTFDVDCGCRIVLVSHTSLMCYGNAGLQWSSGRVSFDSLEVNSVQSEAVLGRYWDFRSEDFTSFTININTGETQGALGEF